MQVNDAEVNLLKIFGEAFEGLRTEDSIVNISLTVIEKIGGSSGAKIIAYNFCIFPMEAEYCFLFPIDYSIFSILTDCNIFFTKIADEIVAKRQENFIFMIQDAIFCIFAGNDFSIGGVAAVIIFKGDDGFIFPGDDSPFSVETDDRNIFFKYRIVIINQRNKYDTLWIYKAASLLCVNEATAIFIEVYDIFPQRLRTIIFFNVSVICVGVMNVKNLHRY